MMMFFSWLDVFFLSSEFVYYLTTNTRYLLKYDMPFKENNYILKSCQQTRMYESKLWKYIETSV